VTWKLTRELHDSGSIIFLGGLLAILSAIGEFLLGNAFSMVTFGVYGGFFLAYGATLDPRYNAYLAYEALPPSSLNAELSAISPGFLSTFGRLKNIHVRLGI
jgi:succinate-acetate transporter protein